MRSVLLVVLGLALATTAHAESVVQNALERISGDPNIVPDPDSRAAIDKSGKRAYGTFKICLTRTGAVGTVYKLRSTGFTPWDSKILGEMRTWKYKPHLVDGRGVPICGAVTFVYRPG